MRLSSDVWRELDALPTIFWDGNEEEEEEVSLLTAFRGDGEAPLLIVFCGDWEMYPSSDISREWLALPTVFWGGDEDEEEASLLTAFRGDGMSSLLTVFWSDEEASLPVAFCGDWEAYLVSVTWRDSLPTVFWCDEEEASLLAAFWGGETSSLLTAFWSDEEASLPVVLCGVREV